MKDKYIKLNDGLYKLVKCPAKSKILSMLWNNKMNISQISRKLGMAYNNTFSNLKELERVDLVVISRNLHKQNNCAEVRLK